jgi:hypothetical protein
MLLSVAQKFSNCRLAALLCLLALPAAVLAGNGCLEMRNAYFWDPLTTNYFIPRGIAYQTWNPPVGANQSFDQIDYDLLEFRKMHANSVRCEFVWSQVEIADDEYDWSKPDHLVAQAEALGLKLFVIIGFQYPPSWFPKEWRGINDRVLTSNIESNYLSDVVNYEHPEARRVYQQHIARVAEHYKNSRAIGAWILGNECAYFDLWEDPKKYPTRRFIGFDPLSQQSFRDFLSSVYQGNIAALNANWATTYTNFNAVAMPAQYPPDHNNPGYHDLLQWRKKSIGDFIALGAVAARSVDPNHLTTYSMVGGIFNGDDGNNTAEDGKTIVARCIAAGAPLDFWSVNNYAWASFGSELRSADYGIAKYQYQTRLPVMISETGHTSTEDSLGDGAAQRQPKAVPSTIWESLLSGAIGVHLFHWSDRSQFVQGYFLRERGFGIVNQNRTIKLPVYDNVVAMFRRMEDIKIQNLLGGSTHPPADVQYFWTANSDLVWPRANQENAMLWGALKRVGYQPGIIDDQQFEQGAYTNAPALLLSHTFQMDPKHLDMILSNVIPAGIHVHANADLPGQFTAYHKTNANWAARMSAIFGLGAANAVVGFETPPTNNVPEYAVVNLRGTSTLGVINSSYVDDLKSWKIWHRLTSVAPGITVLTQTGVNGTQPAMPGLQIKTHPTAKSAINTFGLGDTFGSRSAAHLWEIRYDILRAIYRNHFGLKPVVELTGTNVNYKYVIPDYRICRNGSVLITLLNENTNTTALTLTAPGLLQGKTVENLTRGGILETNSDGVLNLTLTDDDYVLLYAYSSNAGRDESLVNPSPHKLWFESAPLAVWPKDAGYDLAIGYDTQGADLNLVAGFELAQSPNKIFGQSTNAVRVSGQGTGTVTVPIPDADLNDPDYISSPNGGKYVWHAWLENAGARVSETYLPVRLLWAVHPTTPLPTTVIPGRSYPVTLEWQELPSYAPGDPTPLDRIDLWDSLAAAQQYAIVLELRANDRVIVSTNLLTRTGTASNQFSIAVPANATGPFTWSAYARAATNVSSHDVRDSFEGRERGAVWQPIPDPITHEDPSFIAPWESFTYASPNLAQVNVWQNQGVQLEGSHGSQSAFIVATNPPDQNFSGFGIQYIYPTTWSLPANKAQWSNYWFSCDFKEKNGFTCTVQLQVKNLDPNGTGKWIQHTVPYTAGADRWQTVRASLDQFKPSGLAGVFEPGKVLALTINILMSQANAQYVGSFDNIQFEGPDIIQSVGGTYGFYSSANDSLRITGITRGSSGQVIISWIGGNLLQVNPALTGTWTDLTNASPYTVTTSASPKFYRLRR